MKDLEHPVLALSAWFGICLALSVPFVLADGKGWSRGIGAGVGLFLMSLAAGALISGLIRLSRIGVPSEPTEATKGGDVGKVSLTNAAKFLGLLAVPFVAGVIVGGIALGISGSWLVDALGIAAGFLGAYVLLLARLPTPEPQVPTSPGPLGWATMAVLIAGVSVGWADGPAAVEWVLFGVGTAMMLLWFRTSPLFR